MKKILMVIDIQRYYRGNYTCNYLRRVKKFIKTNNLFFDDVINVVDLNPQLLYGDMVPSFITDIATGSLSKMYDSKYSKDMINENRDVIVSEDKDGNITVRGKVDLSKDKSIKYFNNGAMFSIKNQSSLTLDFIDNDFLSKIQKWQGQDVQIYLIGGGLDNCVLKTQRILEVFGIDCRILKEYCYTIKTKKPLFSIKNIGESFFKWRIAHNNNESLKDYLSAQSQ